MGYSDEESLLYNIAELYKSTWQFHKATNIVNTIKPLYPENFRLRMLESGLNDDMQFYGKKMLVLCPKVRIGTMHTCHGVTFMCPSAELS